MKFMDHSFNYQRPARGFSLIELMTVVLVVGILGTIAMSSYSNYILRTNRTEARTGVGEAVALDAFLTELALMSAPDLAVVGEGAGYNDRFRADLASPMAKLAI